MFRKLTLTLALAGGLSLPVANVAEAAVGLNAIEAGKPANLSPVENAQFIPFFFGGNNYCWYYDGWNGPGWYWCGYPWRTGYGWGGPRGWRHEGGYGRGRGYPGGGHFRYNGHGRSGGHGHGSGHIHH